MAQDAQIIIVGEVLGRGVTCLQLRMQSGETISIEGKIPNPFTKGQQLQLTGRFVLISTCMQGRSFLVERFETLK